MIDLNQIIHKCTEENTFKSWKTMIDALKLFANLEKRKLEIEEDIDQKEIATKLVDYWKQIIHKQFEAIEKAKHQGGKPDEERVIYSGYCEELARIYADFETDYPSAREQFQEAYKYNANKLNILLDIAEIDYLNNDFEECKVNINKVLRSEPQNPRALTLLADCMIINDQVKQAIEGFKKVYSRDTTNFTTLALIIRLKRLNGELDEVKKMLEKVMEKMGGTEEPGLNYCRGLYYFYRKNPGAALQQF